jgi:hypothetical protein
MASFLRFNKRSLNIKNKFMAEDNNKRKSHEEQLGNQQKGKSGRQRGNAPQTTATGGQNNGG